MKSIEVSARTIEDAISEGLQKLGCSISDCKVDILQEGAKGLFGVFGSKPASVRLTLTEGDDDAQDSIHFGLQSSLEYEEETPAAKRKTPKAEKSAEPVDKAKKKPSGEKGKARSADSAQSTEKPKNNVLERFRNAPLPEAPAQSTRPAQQPNVRAARVERTPEWTQEQAPERVPVVVPEHIEMHGPATPEGCAQQFLMELTQRMGVGVQVDVRRNEEGNLYVTMYGDTLGILIGRRGDTLDAMQYLTSLQVNRGQDEYTRVTLDTENYRAKREEALSRLANRMANRAIKTGRKVSLEPMNPYERRILHASLQDNDGVTTHSEGDEPYRHVVVVPVSSRTNQ